MSRRIAVVVGLLATVLLAAVLLAAAPASASVGADPLPVDADRTAVEAGSAQDQPATDEAGGAPRLSDVSRTAANGLRIGLLVAVMAVGLSLIFRTSGLINLAHGELAAFGAVFAFLLNAGTLGPRMHLGAATALAVVAAAGLGAGLERGLWRPLRARGTSAVHTHVVVIAIALIIQSIVTGAYFWFVGEIRPYHNFAAQRPVELGLLRITPRDLTLIVISIVVLGAVSYLLQRTGIGRAVRAVGDDPDLAVASGIDVQRVILVVWAVAAGLAALAGVGVGISETVGAPMGLRFLVLLLAGAVLGGLGSYHATIAGSLLVGFVTEMSVLWFSEELRLVWVLVLLSVVLWRSPRGLFRRADGDDPLVPTDLARPVRAG